MSAVLRFYTCELTHEHLLDSLTLRKGREDENHDKTSRIDNQHF